MRGIFGGYENINAKASNVSQKNVKIDEKASCAKHIIFNKLICFQSFNPMDFAFDKGIYFIFPILKA